MAHIVSQTSDKTILFIFLNIKHWFYLDSTGHSETSERIPMNFYVRGFSNKTFICKGNVGICWNYDLKIEKKPIHLIHQRKWFVRGCVTLYIYTPKTWELCRDCRHGLALYPLFHHRPACSSSPSVPVFSSVTSRVLATSACSISNRMAIAIS